MFVKYFSYLCVPFVLGGGGGTHSFWCMIICMSKILVYRCFMCKMLFFFSTGSLLHYLFARGPWNLGLNCLGYGLCHTILGHSGGFF